MRIKTLSLQRWMRSERGLASALSDDFYKAREPVFRRPGIYRRGDACWFELEDGRAFTYPLKQFNFDFDILEASKYNQRQIEALEAIVAQGLATRGQRRLLTQCHVVAQLRRTGRNANLGRRRLFGKRRGHEPRA